MPSRENRASVAPAGQTHLAKQARGRLPVPHPESARANLSDFTDKQSRHAVSKSVIRLGVTGQGSGIFGRVSLNCHSICIAKRSCYAIIRSHEGNSGNAAGGGCFVSNDALDRGIACARDGVGGIRSRGALWILRSLLATALQFSSSPRLCVR